MFKDRSLFNRNKGNKDGLQFSCRECSAKANKQWSDRAGKTCSTCGIVISIINKGGRCHACTQRDRFGESSHITQDGYIMLTGRWSHPNADKDGRILEHRFLMSEHLGRPLLKKENVHHKNGMRADNRISNLELWTKKQPIGQRVEDMINWMVEFLDEQGYDVVKRSHLPILNPNTLDTQTQGVN